jgi:hypothetical protein
LITAVNAADTFYIHHYIDIHNCSPLHFTVYCYKRTESAKAQASPESSNEKTDMSGTTHKKECAIPDLFVIRT